MARATTPIEYRVMPASEIPEGGGVLVCAGDVELGVFRVTGQLVAYENRCMHQGGPVCTGEIVSRYEQVVNDDGTVAGERFDDTEPHLVCPWHGWEYDLENGACATDHRLKLRSFRLVLREDDVFVLV
jgi:nitrite reductase/ring-hydroxylating ferredoxin subunit